MRRLSWRLWCSVIAAAIPLMFVALASTRPLMERYLWTIRGEYDERVLFAGRVPSYPSTDQDLVMLLAARPNTSFYSAAFELAKFAATRKDPAIFAYALRKLSMGNAQPDQASPYGKATIELMLALAEQGTKLDPENDFFRFCRASALHNLGRKEEALGCLASTGKTLNFDNYSLHEFQFRLEMLESKIGKPTASDVAKHWDAIFPADGNWGLFSVDRRFVSAMPPKERLELAARIIELCRSNSEKHGTKIEKYIGEIVTIETLQGATGSITDWEASKANAAAKRAAHLAASLGMSREAKLFADYEEHRWIDGKSVMSGRVHWTPPPFAPAAIVTLMFLFGFGWLLLAERHLDPSPSNSLAVAGAYGIAAFFTMSIHASLANSIAAASITSLCYFGFRTHTLPGNRIAGWTSLGLTVLVGGLLIIIDASTSLVWRLLLMWFIPVLSKRLLSAISSKWVGAAAGIVVAALTALLFREMLREADYSADGPVTAIAYLASIGILVVPWLLAIVSSVGNLTISDAARILNGATPLLALAASVALFVGVRNDVRQEQVWRAYFLRREPNELGYLAPPDMLSRVPALQEILN